MADSKVSALTAATSLAAADQLYLVQSSTSKSITAANLFAAVAPPPSFNDKVSIGDHDTITSIGAIINNVDGAGNLTLAAGVDGQIKIIIMSSNSGGHTVTLNAANIGSDISWDAAGESATLLYDTGTSKWYFIGGNATTA